MIDHVPHAAVLSRASDVPDFTVVLAIFALVLWIGVCMWGVFVQPEIDFRRWKKAEETYNRDEFPKRQKECGERIMAASRQSRLWDILKGARPMSDAPNPTGSPYTWPDAYSAMSPAARERLEERATELRMIALHDGTPLFLPDAFQQAYDELFPSDPEDAAR